MLIQKKEQVNPVKCINHVMKALGSRVLQPMPETETAYGPSVPSPFSFSLHYLPNHGRILSPECLPTPDVPSH